jgi:two-component system chemotaxis response regulator CheY
LDNQVSPSVESTQASCAEKNLDKPKPSILIADDNAVSLDLLRGILANFGCRNIQKFRNGKDAIDAYKTEQSDVIFLDIDMPEMSGLETLKAIRVINPAAFVAIVSGETSITNIQQSLELGAQGFIVKPYSASRVQEVLDKYQKLHPSD